MSGGAGVTTPGTGDNDITFNGTSLILPTHLDPQRRLRQSVSQNFSERNRIDAIYDGVGGLPDRPDSFAFTMRYEMAVADATLLSFLETLRSKAGPHSLAYWKKLRYSYTPAPGQSYFYLPRTDAYTRGYLGKTASSYQAECSTGAIVDYPSHPVPEVGDAAVQFGGSSYIDCGSNAMLRPTGNFSISAWICPSADAAAHNICSNFTLNASGIDFFLNGHNSVGIATGQSGATSVAAWSTAIPLNLWTHLVVVLNGSSVSLYKNGTIVSSQALTAALAGTVSFKIGSSSNSAQATGLMGQVLLYGTNISATDVGNLYSGLDAPLSGSKGYWKLNEGSGTSVADSSGNGNTGTFMSAPAWIVGDSLLTYAAAVTAGHMSISSHAVRHANTDALLTRFALGTVPTSTFYVDYHALFNVDVLELQTDPFDGNLPQREDKSLMLVEVI